MRAFVWTNIIINLLCAVLYLVILAGDPPDKGAKAFGVFLAFVLVGWGLWCLYGR
jgi:hypothetical protein